MVVSLTVESNILPFGGGKTVRDTHHVDAGTADNHRSDCFMLGHRSGPEVAGWPEVSVRGCKSRTLALRRVSALPSEIPNKYGRRSIGITRRSAEVAMSLIEMPLLRFVTWDSSHKIAADWPVSVTVDARQTRLQITCSSPRTNVIPLRL